MYVFIFTRTRHVGATTERESNETMLAQTLQEIFTNLEKSEHSWPFLEAVRKEDVPDYYNVIKDPMDLSKIKERLNSGMYRTKEIFLADINLMCDNCKTYNPPDTIFYKTAIEHAGSSFPLSTRRLLSIPSPSSSPSSPIVACRHQGDQDAAAPLRTRMDW